MKKRKGRLLLVCILVLPLVMLYHVCHNKQQLEDLKSGKLEMEGIYVPANSIHPESAYFWTIPYIIVEVGMVAFYIVYKDHT